MLEIRQCQNIFYILLLFFIILSLTLYNITLLYHCCPNAKREDNTLLAHLYLTNKTFHYPIASLQHNDYQKLIDLDEFKFKIIETPCSSHPSTLLLVLVHSNPLNWSKRTLIRETWGKATDPARFKVLFFVGLVADPKLDEHLGRESDYYGDLIQGSFQDAYRNMTYKHVMLFKYVIYHCPQAKYILKCDDDVFVNMPLMVHMLTKELSPRGSRGVLFCNLAPHATVIRSFRSKWRVSVKEYPGRKYPPYCPGWVVMYSPDVLFALYEKAQESDYFWIDDVHITGTLAQKTGIAHTDIQNVVLTLNEVENQLYSTLNKTFLFGSQDMEPDALMRLWTYVQTHQAHDSVLKHLNVD